MTTPVPRSDLSLTTTLALVVVVVGCGTGCGAGDGSTEVADGGVFVAFGSDFVGFRQWPSVIVPGATDQGLSHVAGDRTVYINRRPGPADAVFAVGTMIVKVPSVEGPIFARVKRGGGYNRSGAVDWEWFELLEGSMGTVSVKWHGVGPPAGETYAGDPNNGCNPCHGAAKANDYVMTPGLELGTAFDAGADGGVAADAAAAATDAEPGV